MTDIARELKLPVGTIYSWSKRDAWSGRLEAQRLTGIDAETSKTVAKVVKVYQSRVEPSNLDLAEKQQHYQAKLGDAAVRLADHVATLNGSELVSQADKLLKADQIARKALKLESEKPSTVIQIGVLAQSRDTKRIEQTPAETLTLDA